MKTTATVALSACSILCLLATSACDSGKKDAADPKQADKGGDAKDVKADAAKDEPAKADGAATPDDVKAADGGAEPADGGAAPADGGAAAAAPGAIGVPECDEYIAKMSKCIEGMDATAAAAAKPGFDAAVSTWKDAIAADPKTNLGMTCKATMDGSAVAYPDCFKAQ